MHCLFLAVLCSLVAMGSASIDKVICYHGSWSYYRTGNGKFTISNIDPSLCTHLIYTFVGITTDGTVTFLDTYLENTLGNLKKFAALKEEHSKVKLLLAVGGWNEGSTKYSNIASSATKRAVFIASALAMVQKYDLDGFDLDWEYPALRGGSTADKSNFATLLEEMREVWDKHDLLLTAAVKATSIDASYDVPALSKYLDVINVMAYDLHGSYDGVTGQNAPLYASSVDTDLTLNVDAAIRGWIAAGASPEKLALGVGFYGRSFTLTNTKHVAVGSATSGAGTAGPYTLESGMLGYNEICEQQEEGGWTTVWDDTQKNPYTYKNHQWIGYDNARSIAIKVEYAKSLGLGGIMLWSIETDDFLGICGDGGKFPLLNAINTAIKGTDDEEVSSSSKASSSVSSSSSTRTSTTTTSTSTTTTITSSNAKKQLCTKAGYIRDPDDCSAFYYCLPYNDYYVALRQTCNAGLYFDPESVACNYAELVDCS